MPNNIIYNIENCTEFLNFSRIDQLGDRLTVNQKVASSILAPGVRIDCGVVTVHIILQL